MSVTCHLSQEEAFQVLCLSLLFQWLLNEACPHWLPASTLFGRDYNELRLLLTSEQSSNAACHLQGHSLTEVTATHTPFHFSRSSVFEFHRNSQLDENTSLYLA